MATEPVSVPEPRTPLSRERVLRAAIRLADEGGFESVTMRRLGRQLGVQAMSLYNHVANKDDIRDGIVEMVMNEIETPTDGEDWKAAIRQSAISTHEVFLRHPWACSLQMATTTFSPAQMQHTEWILRTLREAGFSADMTHHAYHALEGHITGFTLWQVSLPFDSKEELVDLAEGFLREIPVDEYPYIVEHAEQHIAPSSPTGQTEFEFGLDLILDGLERLRDTT